MARPGLMRHRKFVRLARTLGSDALAMGHLEIIWQAAYECGDPILGTAEDLEHLARWNGDEGRLARAMVDSGFVDLLEDGKTHAVHDLFDHAPDYVQARAKREAERRKPRSCAHCGEDFRSTESHAKYCSPSCRQLAYKGRSSNGELTHIDGGVRQQLTEVDARLTEVDAPPAPAPAPALNTPLAPQGAEGGVDLNGEQKRPRKTRKPRAAKDEEYTDEFEAFWREYPRQKSKDAAFRVWKARRGEGVTAEAMTAAAKAYAEEVRGDGRAPDKIKHAATFIGPDRHYKDYVGVKPQSDRRAEEDAKIIADMQAARDAEKARKAEPCPQESEQVDEIPF